LKKPKFFVILDSLGFDTEIRKKQISMAKEKGAHVVSYYFNLPKEFVLHLHSLK